MDKIKAAVSLAVNKIMDKQRTRLAIISAAVVIVLVITGVLVGMSYIVDKAEARLYNKITESIISDTARHKH
ncbi:MAG: hypothetical protein OEW37_00080 [Rhodospirillaceae bacterium]|nr:hypothetical protein [Rhodospirillaceae bacterium]